MTETPASPKANRLATPGWLDTRLVLGVLLVLVSVVVGARVLSSADRSQTVWAAKRDLAPGAQLSADDLTRLRVRLFGDDTKRYINGRGGAPTGYFLRRGVGAGELLPIQALTKPGQDIIFRLVTVPVGRGHLPPSLAEDSQVDLYVTPEKKAGASTTTAAAAIAPRLVVRNVTVLQRPKVSGFAGGGTADESIVLQVRPDDVPLILAAMSEGRIDLVGVPRLQETAGTTLDSGTG
ncbi:MAG: SAF domain-containing protein [Mycobacteriales bacterium]